MKKNTKKTKKQQRTVIASATLRYVRNSPVKARLVMDLIRHQQVALALQALRYNPQKPARLIEKLLLSAVSNAKEQRRADIDSLWVVGGWVNEAPILKRFRPRARGSADQVSKRSSHITVQVGLVG